MSYNAFFWLSLNLLFVIIMAYYSMIEMAAVSFNKVKLQYYVSKKNQRAIWLNNLLQNPSKLFTTTLIGVNVAMMIGSQCSREFHKSIGIPPDLAPLTQTFIVLIFGELAPMFAARKCPEHVSMLGIPILYVSSILMTPALFILNKVIKLVSWTFGNKGNLETSKFLGRDELQKILEDEGEGLSHPSTETNDFDEIVSNIFILRNLEAHHLMTSLSSYKLVPSSNNVNQMKNILRNSSQQFLPIFHCSTSNIIGIAFPRDYILADDNDSVFEQSKLPWFITQHTKVTTILAQFKQNNQSVAIVLNEKGQAIGALSLNMILNEIFSKEKQSFSASRKPLKIIERTIPGDMLLTDFCKEFHVSLSSQSGTISELIADLLKHHPEKGDTIYLAPYELTVKECSLLEAKTVFIKTKIR